MTALAGDDPAQSTAAAYRDHADAVWGCLGRLGLRGHDREDAMQEVFLVVHRRWQAFEGRAAVRTWIYGIAVRVAIGQLRRRTRSEVRAEITAEPIDPGPDPQAAIEHSEAAAVLDRLLDELGDDKRRVFVLADVEGLPVPAVAEMLALNLRTAYSRLRVARADFERAVARWQARRAHVETPPPALARLRREAREAAPPRMWSVIAIALQTAPPATVTTVFGGLAGATIAKVAAVVITASAIAVGVLVDGSPSPAIAARAPAPVVEPAEPIAPAVSAALPATRGIVARNDATDAVTDTAEAPIDAADAAIAPSVRGEPSRITDTSVAATTSVADQAAADATAAEVERLRRAREALRAGDPTDAWVRLQGAGLAGELASERARLRIEALCALGRHAAAREEARAWSQQDPRVELDALLAERCPAARHRGDRVHG